MYTRLVAVIVYNLVDVIVFHAADTLVIVALEPINLHFESRNFAPLLVEIVNHNVSVIHPTESLLKTCLQSSDLAPQTASMRMRSSFCLVSRPRSFPDAGPALSRPRKCGISDVVDFHKRGEGLVHVLGAFETFAGLVASEERMSVFSHEHYDDNRVSSRSSTLSARPPCNLPHSSRFPFFSWLPSFLLWLQEQSRPKIYVLRPAPTDTRETGLETKREVGRDYAGSCPNRSA